MWLRLLWLHLLVSLHSCFISWLLRAGFVTGLTGVLLLWLLLVRRRFLRCSLLLVLASNRCHGHALVQ
jgi:hypothetical protein